MKTNIKTTKNLLEKSITLGVFVSIFIFPITNNTEAKIIAQTQNIVVSQKIINPPPVLLPSIITTYPSHISSNSARLNGSVNPNGLNTTVWFETPNSGPLGTHNIGSGNSPVSLNPYVLTGLSSNTGYTFRTVAQNSNGTNNGNWEPLFTTTPIINTNPFITSISPNSGNQGQTLNVDFLGNNFSTNNGIFKPSANFGSDITVNYTKIVSSTQITSNITIDTNATLGNRNVSLEIGGTYVGQQTFTVNKASSGGGGGGSSGGGGSGYIIKSPNITTQNATNLSKNSAVLNGSINPNGRSTTVWFEYGTMSNLLSFNQTNHISFGSGNSYAIHSQVISNLNPNTVYYFRAVANNSSGTSRGNIFSFTTQKANNIIISNTDGEIEPVYKENNDSYEVVNNTTEENLPIDNSDYFDSKNLGASAIWSFTNILPKTFIGWLIFLILILILIIIIRELYEDHKSRKTRNVVNANHIENLPV